MSRSGVESFDWKQAWLIPYSIIQAIAILFLSLETKRYDIAVLTFLTMVVFSFIGTFILWTREKERVGTLNIIESCRNSPRTDFDQWPTKKLENYMIRYDTPSSATGISLTRPQGVHDVTENAAKMLIDFLPDIRMFGVDLWFDQLRKYSGVFARALEFESEDGTKHRCLQYLFVYTRQASIISLSLWVFMPMLIITSTFFLDYFFVICLWSPLLLHGVFHYVTHPKDPKRTLNSLMPIILYGIIVIGVIIPGSLSISLTIITGFAIFYVFATELEIPKIQERLGVHPMDYVPVFIWLKESRRIGNDIFWNLECACWDKHHYDTEIMSVNSLSDHIVNDTRIRLIMEDMWHSLRLGKSKDAPWWHQSILLIWVYHVPIFSQFMYYFIEIGVIWMELVLGLYLISAVAAGLIALNGPFAVIKHGYDWIEPVLPRTLDPSMMHLARAAWPLLDMVHLSDAGAGLPTLETLWNVKDERWEVDDAPSLKIIEKMQDPFTPKDNNQFTTFRNEP
ncbi:MAG: hypothetical protein ACFFER_06165 [Candidatus Thorarchaeota archaeon]